ALQISGAVVLVVEDFPGFWMLLALETVCAVVVLPLAHQTIGGGYAGQLAKPVVRVLPRLVVSVLHRRKPDLVGIAERLASLRRATAILVGDPQCPVAIVHRHRRVVGVAAFSHAAKRVEANVDPDVTARRLDEWISFVDPSTFGVVSRRRLYA